MEQNRIVGIAALDKKISIEGMNIYWERFGHGPQVVLCLPGLLEDISSSYHPVWDKMDEEKFTLIGIDLPGYGNSRPPDRDYCMEEEFIYLRDARVATKLMKQLGYEKYSLLGVSGGGVLSFFIACDCPDVVEKVVLANIPYEPDARMAAVANYLTDFDGWDEKSKKYWLNMYGRDYTEKVLKSWAKMTTLEVQTKRAFNLFKEKCVHFKAPVLVLVGMLDGVFSPKKTMKLAEFVPHTRFHTVEYGQHSHLTYLDEFVQVTQDFLKA